MEEEPQDIVAEPTATTEAISDVEKYKNEAAEHKDKYLRLLADSENIRKRLQKEKHEMISFAQQELIAEFLQPIDHMENALNYCEQMSEDVRHWGLGFQMILTQFKDVLASNGVLAYEAKGEPFDPHLHEAVETEEVANTLPGVVIEVFVRGYKMGDKIIRPARVKVSK